jgi:hypothetical protein
MSEREVIGLAAPEDSPDWFRKWARDTAYKILKLNRSISTLVLGENISSRTLKLSVSHNTVTQIQHDLNREHQFLLAGAGRMSCFKIVSTTINQLKIIPYLQSTSTVDTSIKQLSSFPVLDASIFTIGDVVFINGAERKITNIVDNVISLTDKVNLRELRSVTLARETVYFLIL